MTLTDAKTFIARVIGGQGDSTVLALAADAILATAAKWTLEHNWEFLRKDNSQTWTVTSSDITGTTVTVSSTAGINVGQVVNVVDNGTNALATTVASITSVTVFELADAVVADGAPVSVTMAAYVPVVSGTDTYYFPADFKDLYGARLLTTKRDLQVIRLREVNRQVTDQTANGFVSSILYSPGGTGSGWTAADPRDRFRLVGIPDTTESLHLDYFRKIDGTASTIDMPDVYLYAFLDDCKAWLVRQKNAQDPRADILTGLAAQGLKKAVADDRGIDDEEVRMKSQFETFRRFTYTPGILPNDY